MQKFVHKRTITGTILVVADVLRPLAPPVGISHEILHTFQNFSLHPVPVYTTGGTSDLNTSATTKIVPVFVLLWTNFCNQVIYLVQKILIFMFIFNKIK